MFCPVYTTQLVRQSSIRYAAKANSSDNARAIAAQMLETSPNEQLVAILLDTKLQVIGAQSVTSGTLDCSLVHPREVFRPAILANASAIILAHNHPSGDCSPSKQDLACFERCKIAGETLGIQCLDSIVVGFEQCGDDWRIVSYSMREGGPINADSVREDSEVYCNGRSKFQIGHHVAFSAHWLRSIGCYTGELPAARGIIRKLQPGKRITIAIVQWNCDGLPERVNTGALAIVGPNSGFCACESSEVYKVPSGRWADKVRSGPRGGILGTFTKAIYGGVSLNFSVSGSINCDDSCKHKHVTCYAERAEKRPDRQQLLAKLRRHETMPAALICGGALLELQDLKRRGHRVTWLRISSAGSLPQPTTVRADKLFRTQFRALLAYCNQNGIPVHIPVETYAKARFYGALAGKLATVRESTTSAKRFVSASGPIAGVAGTRADSMRERIVQARQLAKLRYQQTGRKAISCPAVEASFKSKLGETYSVKAKCGNCTACSRADCDVVYALHEERASYCKRKHYRRYQLCDGRVIVRAKIGQYWQVYIVSANHLEAPENRFSGRSRADSMLAYGDTIDELEAELLTL